MMKGDRVELFYRLIISISIAVNLIATVYFLSNGISIVFQNIYYFTIVLVAFRYRWRGAYFSIILCATYLSIFAFFIPEFEALIQASVRTIIFITIAFIIAFLSNWLQEEKKRYQTIFSASGTGMIIVIGADRTIKESNSKFLELFGERSVVGNKIDTYFDRADIEKAIGSVSTGEKLDTIEMEMAVQTREKRNCIVTIGRLDPDEFVLSIIDITERKKMEVSLSEANRKLSIMSSITRHDMINQLIVISGHVDLMAERHDEEDMVKSIGRIRLAINNIEKQIDFTKQYKTLGGGTPEWFNVRQLFTNAFALLRPANVNIENIGKNFDIRADPLIARVFYNLIENSIHHGGNVSTIKLIIVEGPADLTIIYEDDGNGISNEDKLSLFQKGFGKHTGLGLFFIKEILGSSHITIVENGEFGKGARFEMVVPIGISRPSSNF